DLVRARAALSQLSRRLTVEFGVRVPFACPLGPSDVPVSATTVLVTSASDVGAWRDRRVLVEVCSLDEAEAAVRAGAAGIVARGAEGGGRVGEETTFVLLQQLLASHRLPVWAAGGIGVHSAAAAVVGGASGVVLDAQLALLAESTVPPDVAAAL